MYILWLELRYRFLAVSSDIIALLLHLRSNYLLALVSNGPSAAQWEKVQLLGLQRYFDLILVSGDLPWEKPSPEIFHHACRLLNVDYRKCLMVGDKLETDILGGRQAHLGATVWIPLGGSKLTPNPCPDFTISSVLELPSVLAKRRLRRTQPDLQDSSSNASDGSWYRPLIFWIFPNPWLYGSEVIQWTFPVHSPKQFACSH